MVGRLYAWAGGEHTFWLGIGELRALQQATDVGPLFLLGRVTGHQWMVDDIIHIIRLGLIGGGMPDVQAKKLVDTVFVEDTTQLYKCVVLALNILKDAVMGVDQDDTVGEPQSQMGQLTPEEDGNGPGSTPSEQ